MLTIAISLSTRVLCNRQAFRGLDEARVRRLADPHSTQTICLASTHTVCHHSNCHFSLSRNHSSGQHGCELQHQICRATEFEGFLEIGLSIEQPLTQLCGHQRRHGNVVCPCASPEPVGLRFGLLESFLEEPTRDLRHPTTAWLTPTGLHGGVHAP